MKNSLKWVFSVLPLALVGIVMILRYTSTSTSLGPLRPAWGGRSQLYITSSGHGHSLQVNDLHSSNYSHVQTKNATNGVILKAENRRTNSAVNKLSKNQSKPKAKPLTEEQRLKGYRGSPCHNLSFSNPPLPITALLSYPRSGNTWFRYLLQEATGLVTGSIYKEAHRMLDFPGGGIVDGRVLVVKSHHIISHRLRNPFRAIILIRNPYGSLASFYRWLTRSGTPKSKQGWEKHVTNEGKKWFNTYKTWLELQIPKLVVVYKDLQRDLKGEMRRVFQFLNVTVTDKELQCMLQNSEGRDHNKPANMTLYNSSENATRIIRSHVSNMNKILVQNNFERTIDNIDS